MARLVGHFFSAVESALLERYFYFDSLHCFLESGVIFIFRVNFDLKQSYGIRTTLIFLFFASSYTFDSLGLLFCSFCSFPWLYLWALGSLCWLEAVLFRRQTQSNVLENWIFPLLPSLCSSNLDHHTFLEDLEIFPHLKRNDLQCCYKLLKTQMLNLGLIRSNDSYTTENTLSFELDFEGCFYLYQNKRFTFHFGSFFLVNCLIDWCQSRQSLVSFQEETFVSFQRCFLCLKIFFAKFFDHNGQVQALQHQ